MCDTCANTMYFYNLYARSKLTVPVSPTGLARLDEIILNTLVEVTALL